MELNFNAAVMATHVRMDFHMSKNRVTASEMQTRLERCWSVRLDWSLYPNELRKVRSAAQ